MQAYDTVGVDQDVASHLPPVFTRLARLHAAKHQPDVTRDRNRIEDGPPASSAHSIGRIKFAVAVEQQWPIKLCFCNIRLGHQIVVECHNLDVDVQLVQTLLLLPQLRHMISTRRSAQMSVEDQQQPVTIVGTQVMRSALRVGQLQINGLSAR